MTEPRTIDKNILDGGQNKKQNWESDIRGTSSGLGIEAWRSGTFGMRLPYRVPTSSED